MEIYTDGFKEEERVRDSQDVHSHLLQNCEQYWRIRIQCEVEKWATNL